MSNENAQETTDKRRIQMHRYTCILSRLPIYRTPVFSRLQILTTKTGIASRTQTQLLYSELFFALHKIKLQFFSPKRLKNWNSTLVFFDILDHEKIPLNIMFPKELNTSFICLSSCCTCQPLPYKFLCITNFVYLLNKARNDVLDYQCGADMKLEQCHRHNNGSLACPQTCEDLNPDQDGDCRR